VPLILLGGMLRHCSS